MEKEIRRCGSKRRRIGSWWELLRLKSQPSKIREKKDITINLYAHFFVNSAGKLKLDAFIRFFSVQYLSFVSFRLKSLTFSKFFAARGAIFVVVIPASAAVFVRAKLCRKEKAFQKHKYWKLGKFIDISESVLIYCDLISSSEGGIHWELFL